ncbi:MAG: response regulator transcription factor [Rubrivivax sp.]|nr:response regulator transcription factor [Rubrivivax sp.]
MVLVDDSKAVQRSLGQLLGSVAGIEIVGCAEDVTGALEVIEDAHPHVVVLDVDLRDGERGIDVLRHVVRQHPGIKVVVLSNLSWGAMREGFLRSGASAYFDKSNEFLGARDWIAAMVPPGHPRSDSVPVGGH